MHNVKVSWHYLLTLSIRVFRHSFGLILKSSLKPQSEFVSLFADQESFMRAFKIIFVVVLTKLLLTSNVFSTPTKYSTSNPHSLISGDTHDDIRALRVVDESNTQERGFSFNVDPLLKFVPGTEAHMAAQIAKLKKRVAMLRYLHIDFDNTLAAQLTNAKVREDFLVEGLYLKIRPKSMEKLLSHHITKKDEVAKIAEIYTTAYNNFMATKKRTVANGELAVKLATSKVAH